MAEQFVPLSKRRMHGTKQDWPFRDEAAFLVDLIDVHGVTSPTGQNAWSRLKIIMTDAGWIPKETERASERAMRLSAQPKQEN